MLTETQIKESRKKLGESIKSMRESHGLSVYAFAKCTGLQIKQVQGIESGSSAYTIDSLIKVAYMLGLDFEI